MDQPSFSSLDFAAKKKRMQRDMFLSEMSAVVPWGMLEGPIKPHYPKVCPQGAEPFDLGLLRDELLNETLFGRLAQARRIIEDCRIDCNGQRPLTSLNGLTPNELAERTFLMNEYRKRAFWLLGHFDRDEHSSG